ncbi:MAG: polymer-forming cytoskeletal protein [Sulfuritalea sp.]|nr:polymer-forming cytoskeletal protein [Sulfuritalea sp.]
MSGKNGAARYSHARTDTLVGADLRLEGNLTFTGVLLIQGDTLGDVSCAPGSDGTVVVGKTGKITGTITAPHVVVAGRVHGPMHSSESIEIQEGACVAGDVYYKALDIHAGGVIEGLLISVDSAESDRLNPEHRAGISESSAVTAPAKPHADPMHDDRPLWDRLGAGAKLGGAVAVLVAAIAFVLMGRDPAPSAPPAPPPADVAPQADSTTKAIQEALPASAGSAGLQGDRKVVAGDAVPPAPGPDADTRAAAPAPLSDRAADDPGKVLTVQGVNPGKPAGVFLVISKDPAVLYRKKRQDTATGTRIDISQGSTESISFARGEIFRVEQGHDLTIFYQGKKVAPKIIESGAWMTFVPQPSGAASEKK